MLRLCNTLLIFVGQVPAVALKLSAIRRRIPRWLGGAPWYGKPTLNLPKGLEGRAKNGGLAFSCTGCSKCCRMDGDVWLAPEETAAISKFLGMDEGKFEELYARNATTSTLGRGEKWLCLVRGGSNESSSLGLEGGLSSGCVFLDPFGQCSIYPVRPVQCRTYPFWPSLLEDRETWESEAVLPDDEPLPILNPKVVELEAEGESWRPGRHFSLDEGGCEGINHRDSEIVSEEEITAKKRAALKHWGRFPDEGIKETTWYL